MIYFDSPVRRVKQVGTPKDDRNSKKSHDVAVFHTQIYPYQPLLKANMTLHGDIMGFSWDFHDVFPWVFHVFSHVFSMFFLEKSRTQVAPEIRRELAAKPGEAG